MSHDQGPLRHAPSLGDRVRGEPAEPVGAGWSVPDFSTLSRRQNTLDVAIPYRGSKGALHLLVDSTGIEVEGEGE